MILGQRNKGYVHVRRLLIHMHHSGDEGFGSLTLLEKIQSVLKEFPDLLLCFFLEECRAAGNQRFYQPHAVGTGAAACFPDLFFRLLPVMPLGFDQMKIKVASAGIHIGITGVLFFCTLVMGFDPADLRSFVFCESHDCELGFCHMCFLPFSVASHALRFAWACSFLQVIVCLPRRKPTGFAPYVSFSWGFFVRAYSVLFACV